MTSNLLVRLGSCVLSVLRGKGPHAALGTPPGSEESSSIRSVLTLWSVIGWLGLGLQQ